MTIGQTIFHQMGGSRFAMITGAHNFVDIKNGIRMTLRKNKANAKWLQITLNGKDLYDMEFISLRKDVTKVVAEYNDVYYDMVNDVFESVTGYITKF